MTNGPQVDVLGAVSQLEGLLAQASLSSRDATRCARLAEALRRPARLCLIGPDPAVLHWCLAGLLGETPIEAALMPPALEVGFGDAPRTTATLDDGGTIASQGLPDADVLARAPVFLAIEAPIEALRGMSVLTVCLDADAAQHGPALAWAARRSEIAIWCTRRFGAADARIWAAAPDRLRHHAILVEQAANAAASRQAAAAEFVACLTPDEHTPATFFTAIRDRLRIEMDEARAADIDATRLFLHRLGHPLTVELNVPARPAAAPNADPLPCTADPAALRALISEPLLYLTRRARTMAETLAWMEDDEDWAAEVLDGCCETAERLRDRAAPWPEDEPVATALHRTIEEMGDTALLLQIEGGPDAAATAAALMGQVRWEFEQALATPPAPETGVGR
jgi:hypothetical protein